jgi:hypothetical protein
MRTASNAALMLLLMPTVATGTPACNQLVIAWKMIRNLELTSRHLHDTV